MMSIEAVITTVILLIVVLAILYVISIWIYKRAPANMGFIRTGWLGTKVCLGRGAIVLPVFHELTWVSLETIKLIVSRSRDQAILTADKIRIDVVTELYAHVGHTLDDLLTASRSLGEKTFDSEKVRALLEAKVVSALRSFAATKTLSELHENRDTFAREIKQNVIESFKANGLVLEEVTIVTLEQTEKEYFNADNVFDAEGLKVITEVTSDARRKVHETEKRTTVSIRQKDLDTQLELLEIERQEAFARADQDKAVANQQALQVGQKQIYVLDQRMAVEQKEIDNDKTLEQMRAERDINALREAERRDKVDVQTSLTLEQVRRDREIALIEKTREEEVTQIARALAQERAEKDKEIGLIAKEKERQQADIDRQSAVSNHEEIARDLRHEATEQTAVAMRKRALETRLAILELEKQEAFAAARQEQEVSDEQSRVLSEKQRFILEQRWQIEEEEINKALALERAQIQKDVEVIEETKQREAAEIQRALAREKEERDREIALVAKTTELERARVQKEREVELEEREREIALIAKESQREKADIQRFLAREKEERNREIALAAKNRELELAEIQRLEMTTQREQAEHEMESVRFVADAERQKIIDRVQAEAEAEVRGLEEKNKAEISSMHVIAQAEARQAAAAKEAEATLARARAGSEAQQISADGIEREAGAAGRAEMEIETLRVENTQRMYEAEANGLEAKASALKKYNDSAAYLELAKMHIEADRDIHIDQAKAMATALSGAQIRMYGGGGDDGTVDTIRRLFTTGFGLGEALEGVAQSLPEGVRQRLAQDGVRGLFRRPDGTDRLKQSLDDLAAMVKKTLGTRKARDVPFADGVAALEEQAQGDESKLAAVSLLKDVNEHGLFNDVSFDKVWTLLQATARSASES